MTADSGKRCSEGLRGSAHTARTQTTNYRSPGNTHPLLQMDRRSRKASRRFSIKQDTETNFTTKGDAHIYFGGPYAHIRQVLDYTYHKHYTKERQWLQDSIIDKLLNEIVKNKNFSSSSNTSDYHDIDHDNVDIDIDVDVDVDVDTNGADSLNENQPKFKIPMERKLSEESLDKMHSLPTEPWLIYIVGTENTPKSSAIRVLLQKKYFPILSFVLVDPMEILSLLPEYESYVHIYGEVEGVELMRKETGYISEILTRAALQIGTNVLVYTALWNADWYPKYFQLLKEEFHQLKIAILHTLASNEEDISLLLSSSFKEETNQKWNQDCSSECGFSSIANASKKYLPGVQSRDSAIMDVPLDGKENSGMVDDVNELPLFPSISSRESRRIFDALCKLIPCVEYHCLLQISSDERNVKIINNGGVEVTWESFYSRFQQKCAAIQVEDMPQADNFTNERGTTDFIHKFDVYKSTEENCQSNDMTFYGPYAHLRKTLDYSYHKNYRRDRQMLQDAIISDTLDAPRIIDHGSGQVCTTPTEPFLVFTAGAMGAGKSHTLHFLDENSLFPLSAFVLIDPDEIRQKLPEFSLYIDVNKFTAGELTRKEAGYIVEILTLAALQSGKNVLVDTSLRDSEWYKEYFARIYGEYPNVKLAILHIVAPKEAIFKRAEARGKLTGRVVPKKTLEMALEQVPKSVEILKSSVNTYCALNNSPGEKIKILTEGMTWDKFKQTWVQTCAWIPKVRTKLKLSNSKNELVPI